MRSSSTKNVVCIVPMLVTWEDPGNVSSTLEILAVSVSTPYSARSSVHQSLEGALSVGLEGVEEHVVNSSFNNNGT